MTQSTLDGSDWSTISIDLDDLAGEPVGATRCIGGGAGETGDTSAVGDYRQQLESQRDQLASELRDARRNGRSVDQWYLDRVEALEWTIAELARQTGPQASRS